jgi:hypothetical protein
VRFVQFVRTAFVLVEPCEEIGVHRNSISARLRFAVRKR